MESLLKNQNRPTGRLIDSILILGVPTKTLRQMFLENLDSASPDIIIQLPPSPKSLNHLIKAIFQPCQVFIKKTPEYPSFFSTIYTSPDGTIDYLHCLILHERISPTILELSKERRNPSGCMSFVKTFKEHVQEIEDFYYTPTIICIKTASGYLDLFRKILNALYLQCFCYEDLRDTSNLNRDYENRQDNIRNCIVSTEFIKNVMFLVNDLIIPPIGVDMSFYIGQSYISIPVEYEDEIGCYESCISILFDLIDVKNIIKAWEYILLGKSLVVLSSSSYTNYLIVQALISLIFPFRPIQTCFPVAYPVIFRDVLSNKPLIIGINSSLYTLENIVAIDPSINVLDIDSNIIHSADTSLLCDCFKCSIGQKIQYTKLYYYTDRDRLNIYRTDALEKSINDPDFIKRVKFLIHAYNQKEKNEVFVDVIRHIFFELFHKNLLEYQNFIAVQSLTDVTEFHDDLFLKNIKMCETCNMSLFWAEFLRSKSFKNFIEYNDKKDSLQNKFSCVCSKINRKEFSLIKYPSYKIEITESISTILFYSKLEEFYSNFPKDTTINKFILLTALELHKSSRKLIESATKPEISKKPKEILLEIQSNYFESLSFELNNVFYGDFCIIQLLKGLINPLSKEFFRVFSVEKEIYDYIQRSRSSYPEPVTLHLFSVFRDSFKQE